MLEKVPTSEPKTPLTKEDIEDYTLRVQGMREALQLKREALKGETVREAAQGEWLRDREAMTQTAASLREDARDAEQKGDAPFAKQLEELSATLTKRRERLERVRGMREGARGYSESELSETLDALTLEQMRRAVKPGEKTQMSDIDDETLDIMAQGLKDERRARRIQPSAAPAQQTTRKEAETTAKKVPDIAQAESLLKKLAEQRPASAEKEAYIQEAESLLKKLAEKHFANSDIIKDSYKRTRALEAQLTQQLGQEMAPGDERAAREMEAGMQEIVRGGAFSVEVKKFSDIAAQVGKDREAARAEVIKKSFGERAGDVAEWMRKKGQWYRSLPRSLRWTIAGTLLGLGAAGTLLGGTASLMATTAYLLSRPTAFVGAFALIDTIALRKMENRRKAAVISAVGAGIVVAFLPGAMRAIDGYLHIGDYLREWFGFHKAVVPSGPGKGVPLPLERPAMIPSAVVGGEPSLLDTNPTPGAPPFEPAHGAEVENAPPPGIETAPPVAAGVERLFDTPVQVTDQDRVRGLWGILEKKLSDAHIIDGSTLPQRKNIMIDFLEKKLQALGPEGAKQLGFTSGNINVIHTGEQLDLSILDKEGWINQIKLFR